MSFTRLFNPATFLWWSQASA